MFWLVTCSVNNLHCIYIYINFIATLKKNKGKSRTPLTFVKGNKGKQKTILSFYFLEHNGSSVVLPFLNFMSFIIIIVIINIVITIIVIIVIAIVIFAVKKMNFFLIKKVKILVLSALNHYIGLP